VIRELAVEKLDEAVGLIGAGNDGEFVAQDLEAVIPLLVDEPTLPWWGCNEAVDRGAVGRGAGGDGKGRAVGQSDAGEADDRRIEWCEITTKTGADATGVIGAECRYGAVHDGSGWENQAIVGIYGIDEPGADRLADAYREMIINLDWKWCSSGETNGWPLTDCGARSQQEQRNQ